MAHIVDEFVYGIVKLCGQGHGLCGCVRISGVMCLMQVGQVREIANSIAWVGVDATTSTKRTIQI
jgi:hypothetical protein